MDIRKWHYRYSIDCRLAYPSVKTQENYKSSVWTFLSHFADEVEPKSILNEKIKLWLLNYDSINTRNHKLCAIKSFYEITVGMPLKLDRIPFSKKEQKLPQPLSESEVKALFDACDNLKHRAIMGLLFNCGMRVSEVINLKPEHIDRKRDVINIICGKGKKDRIVPLGKPLLELLEKYYRQYRPKEYMFNGQFSNQYTPTSINAFLKQIAAKAGLNKRLHSHLGRHSYASHLWANGTDLSKIKEILGHNSEKTTRIYTKCTAQIISGIKSPYNFAL